MICSPLWTRTKISWTSHIFTPLAVPAGQTQSLNGPRKDLHALFNLVVNHVPAPKQISKQDDDFRMLATTLGSDPFVGRILTGRVESGKLKVGATVQAISRIGQKIEQFRVTKFRPSAALPNKTSKKPPQATSFPLQVCLKQPLPTRSVPWP